MLLAQEVVMPKPSMRGVLIEAGLIEFRSRGYSATGVQAITDRAGAPRGSFYGHFSSKEAFALEVLDYYERWIVSTTERPDLRGAARLRFGFGRPLQSAAETALKWGCYGGRSALRSGQSARPWVPRSTRQSTAGRNGLGAISPKRTRTPR